MTDRPSILVPVEILEGEAIPEGVPELLANAHVVLLGYHVIPEQTASGQARMQFEDRAHERLDELEAILTEAGATVETVLVFTHGKDKTINRITDEHDCLAVLLPSTTAPLENVLVAVRGNVGADRLTRVVAGLFADTEATITLYHAIDEDETGEDAELLLESVSDRLVDLGMDETQLSQTIDQVSDSPLSAIIDESDAYDAVVMGESDPSVKTFVFGMPTEQLAKQFMGPVFVVQRQ